MIEVFKYFLHHFLASLHTPMLRCSEREQERSGRGAGLAPPTHAPPLSTTVKKFSPDTNERFLKMTWVAAWLTGSQARSHLLRKL